MKKDVCRTDWGTRFVTWISMLCARACVRMGAQVGVRMLWLMLVALMLVAPMQVLAVGWTPSDAGLVVNMEQGERFLLSVVINGKEYFVSNYNRYTRPDDIFNYAEGSYLKLLPQAPDATEPSTMTIWEVGAPLNRGDHSLGATVYTIWNDGKTLRTNNTNYQFMGDLTNDYNYKDACDVVFVIPTNRGTPNVTRDPKDPIRTPPSSFDPNGTLGKGTAPFDGATGTGFLGMTYREVYMFDIPKANIPRAYSNASLVTFNTTQKQKSWSGGQIKCDPGHAAYAYADSKHDPTTRTLFRLYRLDNPIVSCPNTYFFATDEQDFIRYRKTDNINGDASDSTTAKKVYTIDYLTPMKRDGSTSIHRTGNMYVPVPDSTYYYVGYRNKYYSNLGDDPEKMGDSEESSDDGAFSQFTQIRQLPLYNLSGFLAPAGAYGRMVIDSTSAANNHGVAFEPAGYMLKVSTGTNVRMVQNGPNEWITQDMWTLDSAWLALSIRATLMSGPEFSQTDPGINIPGWSVDVLGSSIKVANTETSVSKGMSGYARITTNDPSHPNGKLEFLLQNTTRHIAYNNNTLLGENIPNQYPTGSDTIVKVLAPRLKFGYTFQGWTKDAAGETHKYQAGDTIRLSAGETVLYAQATYDGTVQIALSFINNADGKRYFITHPNTSTPRYARARTFDSWENTWQGMENAENADPNYLSTFELRHPSNEVKAYQAGMTEEEKHLDAREKVLDPRRYTMRGYEDTLMFYEHFAPQKDEYLGLFYTTPNTLLANNTWAGLFTTTSTATTTGWPDYITPYIPSAKLLSTRYVVEEDPKDHPDSLTLMIRSNSDHPYVQYDPVNNQFNGVENEGDATEFQLSAVVVADAHYIIIPDSANAWKDTITFAFHQNEPIREEVWSSLIGKQLMAAMRLGNDTVYFHPNPHKIISNPNDLYLSKDFRVSQTLELIHDSRVSAALPKGDSVTHETTNYHWHNNIVSGNTSPINVKDAEGRYIDIIDTFRITISHGGISKIKEYRGRWKKGTTGLHVSADGSSRYRDVIIRTKTYHYGAEQTRLVLKPEKESYSFGPLVGQTQQINFMLTRETYRQMVDKDGREEGEYITHIDTLTEGWQMKSGGCDFSYVHSYSVSEAVGSHVTLRVIDENTSGVNYDTLIISKIQFGNNDSTINARVPLMQAPLEGTELIWSVVYNKQRYFLTAGSGGLIARKYNLQNQTLYKESTTNQLIKGIKDDANSDKQYITPWQFAYHPNSSEMSDTLTLYTHLPSGTDKYFCITGEGSGRRGAVGEAASLLIYRYANIYVNENANYEEQVRLRYSADGWLKLTGISNGVPTIELTTDSAAATVFSWSYLQTEYNLLNNGTYPSQEEAVFGYNSTTPVDIQTRYKAYREYSMLLNNSLTYLCRKEETLIDSLTSASREWLTTCTIDTLRDHRTASLSGLSRSTNNETLISTITPSGTSPSGLTDIVDTLRVTLSLQANAPTYRFKDDWSEFKSISDANLKIPLVRKAYHTAPYDSLVCIADNDDVEFVFPADGMNQTHVYNLHTWRRQGTKIMDTENNVEAVRDVTPVDSTRGMDFTNKNMSEIRLMDIYGNAPDWCEISAISKNTITVKCTQNGIRSPRSAYIYLAYIIYVDHDEDPATDKVMRFVNHRLTVSQVSRFNYKNNQELIHTSGASGDPMVGGMQQVHENKRILYYYPDQDTELPVRERAFYGWWRWYREGNDEYGVNVADTDVPDSLWRKKPTNTGAFSFPFRTIGDSVLVDEAHPELGKKLITMGRWTVFHYKSKEYNNKANPPAQNPRVAPPDTMHTGANRGKPSILTYAVDISNYYDKLPMSLKDKNQVDVALMDTMPEIIEPTLSLREIFELHPWTEMADTMDHYKSAIPNPSEGEIDDKTYELASEKYMEDHVMMAPTGVQLLLQTEQRYIYENLQPKYKDGKLVDPGHSESLLGYYMHDDNWASMSAEKDAKGWSRKDSMIWCGGWDADCLWYTYDPKFKKYTRCNHPISEDEDFLKVPARNDTGTVYYCLRARSKKTETLGTIENPDPDEPLDGNFWFNICRYKLIYHSPNVYGPKKETTVKGVTKALMTEEEIAQRYEVLERLDFDYIQPGKDYHVYPHPLPWADASYGYTYPETSALPHNRYHEQTGFPNHGEYGLINRIPGPSQWEGNPRSYWHLMEQHGGAANGYMIYCDGMASAGQVAALTLETNLCAGQKLFFSGYVGNPSNQTGKADPNFIFSVQGSTDGTAWEDITSYLTGDIKPATSWYQIYFPIVYNSETKDYTHFRVRIYNVAADFDGNDFIIDDMCIFATKPPLIAYQAQTTCNDYGHSDDETHVLLRLDFQGITGEGYNGNEVCYTVQQTTPSGVHSFVAMSDHYLNETTAPHREPATLDTLYGKLYIPERDYAPQDEDSIYKNMNDLLDRFDSTLAKHKVNSSIPIVREGYIYEILEGDIRPVKYVVHSAKMDSKNDYTVHMSAVPKELLSSICGMTSYLKISSRMVLELNGEEQPETEQLGLCANSTYDISLRVKGSMYRDSVAPVDVTGTCINDWLLYGDTARASSKKRYGYYYSDIEKVVTKILRQEAVVAQANKNQFASMLSEVDSAEMGAVKRHYEVSLDTTAHPYDILADLVNKGFLFLYKSKLTSSVISGDSVQYIIMPIVGTGSKEVQDARVEVCPNPIFIKLKPDKGGQAPLIVGGLKRDSTESTHPITILAGATNANTRIKLRVDSIMPLVGIYSVELRSTDDPNYREGVHSLQMVPDKNYPSEDYYIKGDSITLRPDPSNNYTMQPGYNYTFNIVMQTWSGQLEKDGCQVGTVPFTISVVPNYVRWNPQSASNNNWNDADNWLGIDANNVPIHSDAHFVPMENTMVIIPAAEDGKPYPVVQPLPTSHRDSIQKVGFQYNKCNTIRFLSNAAIGNQQYINNAHVVIDMAMPHNSWAFRAAPVKGMLSGDIFMADADLSKETPLWEVGAFDAHGRSYSTGNASFWLSLYSRATEHIGNTSDDRQIRDAAAEWSKVTNAINLSLPPAQGWAVFTRTGDGKAAAVRLPKNDDVYYYFNGDGERLEDNYVSGIQAARETAAAAFVPGSHAGELAFQPTDGHQYFRLTNDVASDLFVFGNPTMGYIDIWGFIADNRGEGKANLAEEISFMDEVTGSRYTTVSKTSAEATANSLTNPKRYLPPMHAIVLKAASGTTLDVTLNTNRVVTSPVGLPEPEEAPLRSGNGIRQGIMTITAINPVSNRAISHLLLGQGYHNAILEGEDAILTTVNISKYSATATPTTPFNLYAVEDTCGMSIDLLDSIVNVPLSFYMSNLPFNPVTQLWFTGVNNIDGPLVLYDALTDTERQIADGICLPIETPTDSHLLRYYIRRHGYTEEQTIDPIATAIGMPVAAKDETAVKIFRDGNVYIIRNGHVYTMLGQMVERRVK